jgi:NAD(P)-dependent dehydrogenase (short-subunit alcohol dehydrogenase family)
MAMSRFDGRVAIITGAGRGIGQAYAKSLAEEGAKICVTDIIDTDNTVNIIKQAGGDAIGVHCDVLDKDQIEAMVASTIEAYGKVDIMVTNAAIFADLDQGSFMDISEDEWDLVMKINTRGVFSCVKAVVPEMRKNKYGKIVNIASGTVFKGTPNLLHYVSSKGAMIAFTRALAREVGDDNICVNALAPGLTMSEKLVGAEQWETIKDANAATRAFKREELPEDLVGAMKFLCSSDSDFMTGQTILVDGGSAMH